MSISIQTPRGTIVADGDHKVKLTWAPGFGETQSKRFDAAQQRVDSEVLRLSDGYIPFATGMLKKSGILGTIVGSGEVEYIAPYARQVYYSNGGHGVQGTSSGGKRGKLWFERVKADHKETILRAAGKEMSK